MQFLQFTTANIMQNVDRHDDNDGFFACANKVAGRWDRKDRLHRYKLGDVPRR